MIHNEHRRKGTLRKIIEVRKILSNESDSIRIGKRFEIVKENRKLRKTLRYFKRMRTNNYLDYDILVREVRTEQGYYFVCMEGAARISAIKRNYRIKYLRCRVLHARKGVNEIKNLELGKERVKEKTVIRLDDYPEELKREHKGPTLVKARIPKMGKVKRR